MNRLWSCVLVVLLALSARLSAQSYTLSTVNASNFAGGLAVDSSGTLFATNYYGQDVVKVSPTGAVTVIAGNPNNGGSTDGSGSGARFLYPRGLAVDAAGNLYVADAGNQVVRKVTASGVVTTLAGSPGLRGYVDDTGAAARFDTPWAIAIDSSGNLFVTDSGTHTIRKVTPAGVVTTFAGVGGVAGTSDGTGAAAHFNSPTGIAIDAGGNLFVADYGNHTIRKITAAGVVTTLAGLAQSSGFADGVGAAARFSSPQAIALDAAGNLYVADTSNNVIRKVTPAGAVTTLAGLAGIYGDAPGTGSAARFSNLHALTSDSAGTIYVADSYSLKVGTASSQLAVTVTPPPTLTVAIGSAATFAVTATGSTPITYQWTKNGSPVVGATNSTFVIPSVTSADSASYSVTVANALSTTTTAPTTLSVVAALANDNFANAQVITGASGSVAGRNNGATGEPLEPTHGSPNVTRSSVWYAWTAPQTGTAVFSPDNSTFGVFGAAAYAGSTLGSLTRLATTSGALMSFPVTAGSTYFIAVGSLGTGPGSFTVSWSTIANDNFAQAQGISGNSGQVIGNNYGASGEVGEPIHFFSYATATSIWYRWTASQNGVATFDTANTIFDTAVAVYTGTALTSLTRVAQDYNSLPTPLGNRSRVSFVATANTTYYIAVGSAFYGGGGIVLNWQLVPGPVITSAPAGASITTGSSLTLSVSALSALPLTYQWLRNDVPIPGANTSSLALVNAQASDTAKYSVVVSNGVNAVSVATTVTVLVPPPNDNFANAQAIAGLAGTVNGSNVNATGENGEPVHWNVNGTQTSVWYKWTPAASGLAVIDTVGSNFDTVMAVYTGSAFSSLNRIAQDDDSGGGHASHVGFTAIGGTTYFIAIGGSNLNARGSITLNWQLTPALAIATQPASQTIAIGGSATFSVAATGTGVTYQWFRNGTAIPGATAQTLTVGNVQGGADANYTVTVTSSTGSVTSAPATLAVAAPTLTTLTLRNARPTGQFLWGIAAGNNTLVAVGDAGTILSSLDNGVTWTPRSSGTTNWIVGVTYGNGQFVAVGDRGLILLSPDGISWTPAPSTGTAQRLNNVLYADGKYVAVGEAGTIVTSLDGRIWAPRVSGITTWLHGLAYNANIGAFAASGQSGVVLYSTDDGATWNQLPVAGLTDDLEAIVAVDSYAQFVAIGGNGAEATIHQNQLRLKTGETLTTWSADAGSTGSAIRFRGLVQGASALFATGENGKVITATDNNGPWYTLPTGTNANLLAGLYYNNSLFIVGEGETILQSDPLYASRLINISTRGQVGTGANIMISGFVITGAKPKQVLVRAAGPTLASSFGLAGTLAAPVLSVIDAKGNVISTNAGWNNNDSLHLIAATAAHVGAFPFSPGSADSALLLTLDPGQYTAQIAGANNTTGLSIVEVYDADAIGNDTSRAINISTRGIAGTGANQMIAGFVIDGASSRKLLIRAVGPGLTSSFGVPGTLAAPQIELYKGQVLVASAGAWGLQSNADEIRGAFDTAGAFPLVDGSKDSAMVVTLLPGAWTVQVSGVNNTTGVVLVEVYALP